MIISIIFLFSWINQVWSLQNAFSNTQLPLLQTENTTEIGELEKELREGLTPGKIVIEKIVAYLSVGEEDEVILRNIGGQTVDLTGWRMTDSQPQGAYVFGGEGCEGGNATIGPQEFLKIRPFSDDNPCGFQFGISFRDSLILYNTENKIMANVTWGAAEQGTSLRRLAENQYTTIPESSTNIIQVLKSTGKHNTFIKALQATGLSNTLKNNINPKFTGVKLPSPPPAPIQDVQFPWWFGFAVDRSTLPPPPPPPPPPPAPPVGVVPELGPYTVLAPSDEAFDQFRLQVGGGKAMIPMEVLLELPELKDLLQYHIMFGDYTSDYMFNNSGIRSALGPEVVIMKDPSMTEGNIAISDSCVDKQTSAFPCQQQKQFGKCFEPFMVSPLAANWQGGFCQKTCGRCTCKDSDGGMCAKIDTPDLIASNGVIQGITRVLFPPPIFGDEIVEEAPEPEVEPLTLDTLSTLPVNLPVLPTLPSLAK